MLAIGLAVLVAGAAVVSPRSVPARGAQEAFVEVEEAGAVVITAQSAAGTSCALVDQRRGPVEQAGAAGRENCTIDTFLDPGRYKLRLRSPAAGKGEVQIAARMYEELNQRPLLLEPGGLASFELHPRQQASFWIHREEPGPISLRVLGRTAGRVELWHDGLWRREHGGSDGRAEPRPDAPLHEWLLEETLEAGDTRVTVYGTSPLRWTSGMESDQVAVLLDAPDASAERLAEAVLPAWGLVALRLPSEPTAVVLVGTGERTGSLSLALTSIDGEGRTAGNDGGCMLAPTVRPARCVAVGRRETRHVAIVRGPPGASIRLHWAAFRSGSTASGEVVASRSELTFSVPASGPHLLAVRELSPGADEAPLSCALLRARVEDRQTQWETIDRSYLRVTAREPFERSFNVRRSGAELWFELGDWGLYTLEAKGDLKSRCTLLREGDEGTTEVARSDDGAKNCKLTKMLTAGRYQLHLSGGDSGVERLRISSVTSPAVAAPARSSCLFRTTLDTRTRYRVLQSRTLHGEGVALTARPLPLQLEEALLVELDPEQELRLPLAPGRTAEVLSTSDAVFDCGAAPARGGRCAASAPGAELVLRSHGAVPTLVAVRRPSTPPAQRALAEAHPKPIRPPELVPGTPLFVDLAGQKERTFVFTVREGGLWELSTQGLLATACALRTPTVPALARDEGSGRGRNCLVSTVLSPGRYAASVTPQGASRGRASVTLVRRSSVDGPPLAVGTEAFFRAAADELVVQKVQVPAAGLYTLSVAAQGAPLSCRLEDEQGWPLAPVPSSCAGDQRLAAGALLLSELPLTVESQRHARLVRVKPPVRLKGSRVHPIALNQRYDVSLAKRGFDRLRFKLEAPLTVSILLTSGMQGRLYRNGGKTPVEVVPPQGGGEVAGAGDEAGGDNEAAPEGAAEVPQDEPGQPPEPEPADASEDCEGGDCAGSAAAKEAERARAEVQRRAAASAAHRQAVTAGPLQLDLEPGDYVLRTEHSRADVAVTYQVAITSAMVAPGLATEVLVPDTGTLLLPLVMPRAGTLRLRTEGETDVRCRLFSGDKLVAASDDDGADWNCALTEPLAAGRYGLALESETRSAGRTLVVASLPEERDMGPLAAGTVRLAGEVLAASLPAVAADTVEEVHLSASEPFSCALEDEAGVLRFRSTQANECALLLRGGARHRLRAWNGGRPFELTVTLGARPVASATGALEPGTAARAVIARSGRWATGEGLFCLPEGERGVLRPCGPSASLEQGPVIFAPLGFGTRARLELQEQPASVRTPREESWALAALPLLERERSEGPTLQLLSVRVPRGSRSRPSCSLVAELLGSARLRTDDSCFAAAGYSEETLARASAPSGLPVQAQVTLRAVPLPRNAGPLAPGRKTLSFQGTAARWTLPAGPARVELLLPEEAWAVLLDPRGGAADLCAPAESLASCTLQAEGGELAVWSPREPQLEVSVVGLPAAPVVPELTSASGLLELRPAVAGALAVRIPAEPRERIVTAQGASRCVLELGDGGREQACTQTVPAGIAAVLRLVHGAQALRIALAAPDAQEAALAGPPGPLALAELPRSEPGRALALSGTLAFERRLELDRPWVAHLRASTGSCALRDAAGSVLARDGLGEGCRLDRLLPKGSYRLTVRPFADVPLRGELTVTAEEPLALGEGVGDQHWLGGGELRLFRFSTASAGDVGLGLRTPADLLTCRVLDQEQRPLGEGCQQLLHLPQGDFLLEIRAPDGAPPLRFRPVLLGLTGGNRGVPDDVLRELLSRLGEKP